MANNYTEFSIILPPQPFLETFLENHEQHIAAMKEDERLEYGIGYEAEVVKEGLWIKDADGWGNLEGASYLIQRYLQQYIGAPEAVILEFASYCDKPRPGEFYGGARLITKDNDIAFDPYAMALATAQKEGWTVYIPE